MHLAEIFDGILKGKLKPRYSPGTGLMEMALTPDISLHVYHPEIPAVLESFGNRHDHHCDMQVTVLFGTLYETSLMLEPQFFIGKFRIMTSEADPQPWDDNRYGLKVGSIRRFNAGDQYGFPSGSFHEVKAQNLTVTISKKSNRLSRPSRILVHEGQNPGQREHHLPQTLLNQFFFSALRQLSLKAGRNIEEITSC